MSTESREQVVAGKITASFPHVPIEAVEEMPHVGWGGDSDVWLVNDTLIFRFPRSAEVAAQLAVEVCLLPQLAPTLPLPIPAFQYVATQEQTGGSGASAPPSFAGYPSLGGQPMTPTLLDDLILNVTERADLAGQLGGFLAALHGFPVEQARACGAAESMHEPDRTSALYDRTREFTFPLLAPAWRAWTDRLFGDALARRDLWDYTPALVHGDLGTDHILFDRTTRRITGIIDFGDMSIGDPVGDFVGLASYGEAFLATALTAYTSSPDPPARERLRFYRKRLPFIALAWGAEHGDAPALAEGMARLRAVLAQDDGAIGQLPQHG